MTIPRPAASRVTVAAVVAAITLASLASARAAGAQVRTTPVDVRYFHVPRTPLPFAALAGAPVVAMACERHPGIPRGPTRCHEMAPPSSPRDSDTAEWRTLVQCAARGASPARPDPAAIAEVRRALERNTDGSRAALALLPGTAPRVLVMVRWTDVATGFRCVRWTNHCQGLDCRMAPGPHCAASVPAVTRQRTTQWALFDARPATLFDAPPYFESGVRVQRIDAAALTPADAATPRATVGQLDTPALRALATSTQDPVVRYAAWVDLAVDAWRAGDTGAFDAAYAAVVRAQPEALAAAPAAARADLAAPGDALTRARPPQPDRTIAPPCAP